MAEAGVPEGFVETSVEGTRCVLRADLADALLATGVADPEAAAAAAGDTVRTFEGRGRPVSFPVPGAGLRVVARRYLHGGLLGGLTGGLFRGPGRFERELALMHALHSGGAPVPEPLGIVVEAAAGGLVRGWLLSREIEAAEDLRALLLRTAPGDPARRAALAAAGRAVRRLHDAGCWHADLHVKNLLVAPGDEVVVLDLDGARGLDGGLSRDQRAVQIQRLDRSFVKLAVRAKVPVSRADRRRLVRAYLGDDRPTPAERERWRRRHRAHLARHRLGWALGAG